MFANTKMSVTSFKSQIRRILRANTSCESRLWSSWITTLPWNVAGNVWISLTWIFSSICCVSQTTYHSSEGRRNQPTVDGDETAADECLWTECRVIISPTRSTGASTKCRQTCMSSSLELNSETRTFSPSDTRVNETHSLPEATTCASDGRSRFRPDFRTFTRLKVGWSGPRFLFLASFATSITSSQHLAGKQSCLGHVSVDQKRAELPGVSDPKELTAVPGPYLRDCTGRRGHACLLVSLPGILLNLFMKVEVKKRLTRAQTCDLMDKYLKISIFTNTIWLCS